MSLRAEQDETIDELASLFARGVLRLRKARQSPTETTGIRPESSPKRLEVDAVPCPCGDVDEPHGDEE